MVEKEKIYKNELKIILIISFIILAAIIYLSIQTIKIFNTNLDLNAKLNTNIKFFDCRNIQRDDIIIGIENQSLLLKIKDSFSFNFTEEYLIDNPFVCRDNECKQFMFNETEEADWVTVSGQCKLYEINLRELI